MKKLQSFRTALLASSPGLTTDPQNVAVFAEHGRVVSGAAPGRGFVYHYQITALVQDFAGDVDAVADAVLQWIRLEMPGTLANNELADKAFRFQVELMTSELADLQIEVDVIESVAVDAAGTATHPPEPSADLVEDALWRLTT